MSATSSLVTVIEETVQDETIEKFFLLYICGGFAAKKING
jgi:hypothetical protein